MMNISMLLLQHFLIVCKFPFGIFICMSIILNMLLKNGEVYITLCRYGLILLF